ncbi:hypothetical protein SAMN02745181_0626 [Rubritalea squalenifaciens DSM 18772]|uniref:Uncharacterized protein n=1 Tax=Rubritalea squalenifaciens DSM 18772 TaxID=1123071 RepID=A0A1M6D2E6_9BACT|nr:hypothetical protein [Rubritalea squalenifaciens]SHI67283.1 hypothetical protein SAMN02745181_0626 [Rubritalea squalenifaciens DSM 18772]
MTPQSSHTKLSANKVSLIILASSVALTLVIGLVIASGKDEDSSPVSIPPERLEAADSPAASKPTSRQTPPAFASVFLLYEKIRQAKLDPEFKDLSLARDWAIYTGTSLSLDSSRKSGGQILGKLQPVGDIGELQFFELPNYTFRTPKGEKIPGMYADQKLGLNVGQGWRIPLTTPENLHSDLIITIHYSAYRTNLTLKVRNADGTMITASPLPYTQKAICGIRTTLQNLQPDTPYYLELVVDSYYTDNKSTRANAPHGLGINAVVVE